MATVSRGLGQAYDIQDALYKCLIDLATSLKNPPDPDACESLAKLERAWSDAQDRIRIHRGKLAPGTLSGKVNAPQKIKVDRSVIDLLPDEQTVSTASEKAPVPAPAPAPEQHS